MHSKDSKPDEVVGERGPGLDFVKLFRPKLTED
jgi:hypothetical protein